MGSHGVDPELVKRIEGTLDETPIARHGAGRGPRGRGRAAASPATSPPATPSSPTRATITCTPISAARRWLGVIFADRDGEDFALDDGERETMLTLGRLAALTASVEHSTEQRESERRLAERVELTRDLHENAIQRLFGVALALGSERRALGRGAPPLPGGAALGRRRPAPRADPPGRAPPQRAPDARAWPRCWSALLERRPELRAGVGGRGRGARPTSSRSPSRSWPRRCATPTATRARAGSRSASPPTATPSASRSRTTAPATATRPRAAASACGWRRWKRCATRAWSSSAPLPAAAGGSASSPRWAS